MISKIVLNMIISGSLLKILINIGKSGLNEIANKIRKSKKRA